MVNHVLVIGAGVAGLAAATALRDAGVDVTVIEAAARIGGRALTTHIGGHAVSTHIGAYAFDHGATWLHDADRNPLADLARGVGATLIDSDTVRRRHVLIDGRLATAGELAHRARTWEQLDTLARTAPDDIAYADALAPLRADPWTATIEGWEACQIAAADPRDFSVQDWRINGLEGRNLSLPQGIGAFVARHLGPPAGPVELSTPVTALDWRGPMRNPILAETPRGTLRADACIVTVSTAALQTIRFTPALPISPEGLPMGLLTKIAFPATGVDRLDLAPDQSVSARIDRGEAAVSLLAWPGGADHVAVFIGGPPAWALAREGRAATIDFIRTRLRAWFGTRADTALGAPVFTDWSQDPWQRGAYAYARPGYWRDRGRMAEPLMDGRLVLAGEAYRTDGLAGTVGGAYLDGERAAAIVRAALQPRA